ncbi:NAD(P)H-quinone dehydrogenase [Bowdeniella nasicola]|uniref:NAD(P)H-quinone dehydrogenase n=1 Tax=Bowdeniella nasicola TaxID=208480 RepID=UPI001FE437EE|nr:NAD(P)H-quinone dehydrogenase [Bowdeniella nasicola]
MTVTSEHSSTAVAPESPAGAQASGSSPVRAGSRVVIIGGGPGGYEAALVARQLGADVTVIEARGMGGSAVLTDVVPSKTLIATAEWMTLTESAVELGIHVGDGHPSVDLGKVNERVRSLAAQQERDIAGRLEKEGITIINGHGRLGPASAGCGTRLVYVDVDGSGEEIELEAEMVLIATGATPRELPDAKPDGERILTWKQLYELTELPEHLIVVGSGVTGAEFAGAYTQLGAEVTLVSSRVRVLPGEDEDAATLIENVFKRRGMTVLSESRAQSVTRTDDGVLVTLADGREITGSHCLMAVGAIPNTKGIGLEEAGVKLRESGHIEVDRVSRTTAFRVYAAGDCTGVYPLASVAAMQGRIAMWHALGDAVSPLSLTAVAANIFTAPEIATIGVTQAQIESGEVDGSISRLPVARNPRAKMLGIKEGFVKVFSDNATGVVTGAVVVAPRASELIFPLSIAVTHRLTVDEVANVFTIYPSLSGTLGEAARTLHHVEDDDVY